MQMATGGKSEQRLKCGICLQLIVESSEKKKGDDAIYCEGACQAWFHRKCIRLPKTLYVRLSDCSDPFLCNFCRFDNLERSLDEVRSAVSTLSSKLDEIVAALAE